MLQGEQFTVIYLEDLLTIQSEFLGIQLMQLIVARPRESDRYVQRIVSQIQNKTDFQNQAIIELVNTVMVYKFPELSREEIETMFSVSELKQTRVYRDAMDEGRVEGRDEGRVEGRVEEARALVLRLLAHRFGAIDQAMEAKIRDLSLSQVEDLGEALLDFAGPTDLGEWLQGLS